MVVDRTGRVSDGFFCVVPCSNEPLQMFVSHDGAGPESSVEVNLMVLVSFVLFEPEGFRYLEEVSSFLLHALRHDGVPDLSDDVGHGKVPFPSVHLSEHDHDPVWDDG